MAPYRASGRYRPLTSLVVSVATIALFALGVASAAALYFSPLGATAQNAMVMAASDEAELTNMVATGFGAWLAKEGQKLFERGDMAPYEQLVRTIMLK